jgi:hypothetical protein
MQNYGKVAGILNIVGGAIGVIWLLFAVFVAVFLRSVFNTIPAADLSGISPEAFSGLVTAFYLVWGVFAGICGALAIVGGVYALKGKNWGLALAGSIASILTFMPLGVVATIFTVLAKPEFGGGVTGTAAGGTPS